MPYTIRKQKCKRSDGTSGSYVLSFTDKKGKHHRNCHTSRKKARGQITAIEAEATQLEGFMNMNDEKLLREFISWNVKDDAPQKKDGRKTGIIDKIKSFFTGNNKADEITNDWLDDTEMSYGFEVPSDIEKEARKLVRLKLDDIMSRTRGDVDKAERIIRKALDKRFLLRFRELEKQVLDDEDIDI